MVSLRTDETVGARKDMKTISWAPGQANTADGVAAGEQS